MKHDIQYYRYCNNYRIRKTNNFNHTQCNNLVLSFKTSLIDYKGRIINNMVKVMNN